MNGEAGGSAREPVYGEAFLGRLRAGLAAVLPRWGFGAGTRLGLLAVSENATFLAEEPDGGRRTVLRVHRPAYHGDDEILSELAWIAALIAEGVVATPRPLPAADGALLLSFGDGAQRHRVVAFEHMAGAEPAVDGDLPGWFRRLGETSARLHAHARAWPVPAGFRRKVWDFETTLGRSPHWGDWRAGPGLGEDGRRVVARAVRAIEARLERYGKGEERFGLVHADLRLANLLVHGGRLGVIDFDDCGTSWFAYDFAASVSFIEHEPVIPALRDAWVAGYRSVAAFSGEDEAMLPVFVMLRRILLTAWIASHRETPTARALGPAYTRGTVALAAAFLREHG